MKFEWKLIVGASLFLGAAYALYWFTSYEDAGSVMLLFGGCAYLMLGGFLLLQWRRRQNHLRPEDDPQGSYEAGSGEVAFFPSASIWPAGIGLGAIFVALGLVWGNWYLVIGIPLMLGAIIGFVVEAEAGGDAEDEARAKASASPSPSPSPSESLSPSPPASGDAGDTTSGPADASEAEAGAGETHAGAGTGETESTR